MGLKLVALRLPPDKRGEVGGQVVARGLAGRRGGGDGNGRFSHIAQLNLLSQGDGFGHGQYAQLLPERLAALLVDGQRRAALPLSGQRLHQAAGGALAPGVQRQLPGGQRHNLPPVGRLLGSGQQGVAGGHYLLVQLFASQQQPFLEGGTGDQGSLAEQGGGVVGNGRFPSCGLLGGQLLLHLHHVHLTSRSQVELDGLGSHDEEGGGTAVILQQTTQFEQGLPQVIARRFFIMLWPEKRRQIAAPVRLLRFYGQVSQQCARIVRFKPGERLAV